MLVSFKIHMKLFLPSCIVWPVCTQCIGVSNFVKTLNSSKSTACLILPTDSNQKVFVKSTHFQNINFIRHFCHISNDTISVLFAEQFFISHVVFPQKLLNTRCCLTPLGPPEREIHQNNEVCKKLDLKILQVGLKLFNLNIIF